MPLYEINHAIYLSTEQKASLAQAITQIHSKLFTTPSFFVNVRFVRSSEQDLYIGGKKKPANLITANVRAGGGRSTESFNGLCSHVEDAWKRTVEIEDTMDKTKQLRSIFVLGSIIAASEAGLAIPPAGEDKSWLKDNVKVFRKRADAGDEDFKDMLVEMETREDLKGSP